ncbi:hypothetical protein TNIN_21741 [Trichonephila inaurata madagascariensis]|uniref:Uncharacterized protein n=1 Tax=Trichonephila inaurata madagascariensis TaxID=2747483 RepID=A0A8X6YKV9_9ARAC|nr:hypothetical protein TNIN_21741 [Trichonephila inaurata madagascariensis]
MLFPRGSAPSGVFWFLTPGFHVRAGTTKRKKRGVYSKFKSACQIPKKPVLGYKLWEKKGPENRPPGLPLAPSGGWIGAFWREMPPTVFWGPDSFSHLVLSPRAVWEETIFAQVFTCGALFGENLDVNNTVPPCRAPKPFGEHPRYPVGPIKNGGKIAGKGPNSGPGILLPFFWGALKKSRLAISSPIGGWKKQQLSFHVRKISSPHLKTGKPMKPGGTAKTF